MSVVVRMEMPQHCGECNLYVGGWCYVLTPDSPQEKEWYASHKERPPMCPIICQLPEGHGRLGDLDELLNLLKHESFWHYINEASDLPDKTGWYVVKLKGSDDLSIVYGFEKVNPEKHDAWIMVNCPY